MHPRNKNRESYDLQAMTRELPELRGHIIHSKSGRDSINFSDPNSVRILNRAILQYYYGIDFWEFPKDNLCPAIPGRADYIHHLADLLASDNKDLAQFNPNITCLDIGTGASCIYPIIGTIEYGWNFIGTDIDANSLKSASEIVRRNPRLKNKISFIKQSNPNHIFRNILKPSDQIELSMCNPPFHSSVQEAIKSSKRKVRNLTKDRSVKLVRNFSGNQNELVYEGGEYRFVRNMILESKSLGNKILWFSVLISKESNIQKLITLLKQYEPYEYKTIDLATGNKKSRILIWTYIHSKQRKEWLQQK